MCLKTIGKYLLSAISAGVLLFGLWVFGPDRISYFYEFRTGDRIVAKVEHFKALYGRYPDDLKEVGWKSDDSLNIFYRKESNNHYIVWFGTTMGESISYDSQDQKWH